MIPSNGFVFEDGELDIMMRKPRNQIDRLVGGKMITFSYLQQGVISSFGALLQWFIIMNDFGIPPMQLFWMCSKLGYSPLTTDTYDPNSPWLGNSNLKKSWQENGGKCDANHNDPVIVDWLFMKDSNFDLR